MCAKIEKIKCQDCSFWRELPLAKGEPKRLRGKVRMGDCLNDKISRTTSYANSSCSPSDIGGGGMIIRTIKEAYCPICGHVIRFKHDPPKECPACHDGNTKIYLNESGENTQIRFLGAQHGM